MVYGHGKIGRNVTISHCHGQHLNTNVDPPEFMDFDYDVYGCYTKERATRYARRVFGDSSIVINNVEHETEYYAMTIEEFVNYAQKGYKNGN